MSKRNKGIDRFRLHWGDASLDGGYAQISNNFLRYYHRLGIKPMEALFIVHLAQSWYDFMDPRPSLRRIAERMGVERRTVQRYSRRLEVELGLIRVYEQYEDVEDPETGEMKRAQVENLYDLSPLIEKVNAIFLQEKERLETESKNRRLSRERSEREGDLDEEAQMALPLELEDTPPVQENGGEGGATPASRGGMTPVSRGGRQPGPGGDDTGVQGGMTAGSRAPGQPCHTLLRSEENKKHQEHQEADGGGAHQDERVALLLKLAQAEKGLLDFDLACKLVEPYTVEQVAGLIEYTRQAKGLRDPLAFAISRLRKGDLPKVVMPEPARPVNQRDCQGCGESYYIWDLCRGCGRCEACCQCAAEVVDPVLAESRQVWEAALGELALQMTRGTFNTWLKPTRVLARENGVFIIGVDNGHVKDWLENRLQATILRTLQGIVKEDVEVQFVVEDVE